MKKIFYFVGLLIIVLSSYYVFKKTKKKSYKVGMMSGWPPFMSINAEGQMEGFDVDIINHMNSKYKSDIEIIDCGSLPALFFALENNKIDAIMSGLDVTTHRKQAYDYLVYADAVLNNIICVSSFKANSFEDLIKKNPVIAFEGNAGWEPMFDQFNKTYLKIYLMSVADMLMNMNVSKIDAFLIDEIQYQRIADLVKDKFIIKIPVPQNFVIDGIGIFFKKGHNDFKALMQDNLQKMLKDETIEMLIKKWNIM